MARLSFRFGLALCALLLASPAHAQQPLHQHTERLGALGTWHAAQQAAAPFVVTAYAFEFLDPSQQTPTYMVFLDGTRSYSNGRLAEEIIRSPDFFGGGTTLVNQSRTTYAYTGGRTEQVVHYEWTNNNWVPSSRTSYTYNGAGQMLTTTEEAYDATKSAWENRYRTTFTYAAGIPQTVLDEVWSGSAWAPEFRSTISESGSTTVIVEEAWNGAQWVNDSRTTYNDTIQNLLAAQVTLEAVIATPLFAFAPPDRTTAEAFYALTYTEERWDPTANAWVNDERLRVTTNTATTLQVVEETWNATAWNATSRTTLTFNGQNVTENLQETSSDGATFDAEGRTTYTYDTNGNPVLAELFADDDGDGTLETTASSRIRFTWTDLGTGTATDGEAFDASAHLAPVAPTPTRGTAAVAFHLGQTQYAALRVYDALGREVALLADGVLPAGDHTRRLDTAPLATGLYLVRLETGTTVQTRALVVVR